MKVELVINLKTEADWSDDFAGRVGAGGQGDSVMPEP